MKKLVASALLTTLAMPVLAQKTTTDLSQSQFDKIMKNVGLTLETEIATKRDDNNEIKGNETYYLIEPSYKINSKSSLMVGAQYKTRELGGDKIRSYGTSSYTKDESKNRDALEEMYIKYLYKATSFKENGIADVRLQARAYSTQDSFFKEYYGNDGNYQLRAYFGRPLVGNFYINKYTSYLRYKNYTPNQYTEGFGRDYELRARISPTYQIDRGFDLGMTLTYNHIFAVDKSLADQEDIDLDFTVRYQKGKYAAMLRAGTEILNNEESGDLKQYDDAGKEIGYALTLTAYL